MAETNILVKESFDGLRLDVFLHDRYPEMSRSYLQKIINDGLVCINGKSLKKKYIVRTNNLLTINFETKINTSATAVEPQEMDIDVVWEDEYIAVINKQAGLVVHPGNGNRNNTLANGLRYKFSSLSTINSSDRPGIVHRLDKDTSGLLIVAKTDIAHRKFAKMFSTREIVKEYIGICIGSVSESEGVWEWNLSRKTNERTRFAVNPNGRYAKTGYNIIANYCGISVVKYMLFTGRTHQIRVHSSHAGIPILHDDIYGGDSKRIIRIAPMERPFAHAVYKSFRRQALHAWHLEFQHPLTGEVLSFFSDLPDDFQKALGLFAGKKIEINLDT